MTTITHPQLVAALVKPPLHILQELTPYGVDLWHGATGIAGEAGELLEAILFPPEAGIDRVNVREELGDLYFYVEQVCQRTGIVLSREAIMSASLEANLNGVMLLPHAAAVAVHGSQVLDTVKKTAIYNKRLDLELLTNQLGALSSAMLTLGHMFGIEREEAMADNIHKLSKRYESLSYSDTAAQTRADKVQPPEGIIPSRKFFSGEPPVLPPETTDIVQPHVGKAEMTQGCKDILNRVFRESPLMLSDKEGQSQEVQDLMQFGYLTIDNGTAGVLLTDKGNEYIRTGGGVTIQKQQNAERIVRDVIAANPQAIADIVK
jgi:hypothetical protein